MPTSDWQETLNLWPCCCLIWSGPLMKTFWGGTKMQNWLHYILECKYCKNEWPFTQKLWHVDNIIWEMNLNKHCTNCTNLVNGACVALNGLLAILLQNYFSIQIFFKISSKIKLFVVSFSYIFIVQSTHVWIWDTWCKREKNI